MRIEEILKRYRKSKKDYDAFSAESAYLDFIIPSTFTFVEGLNASSKLDDSEYEPMIRIHVINNFLANIVTSLEIYFKTLIQQYDNWDEEGYKKLFKEKITLSEAFELFNRHKVTRQFLIAEHYSFQNFAILDNVLSCLTGDSNILNKIETFETDLFKINGHRIKKRSSLNKLYPEWRKTTTKLFDLRHEYIHEGKTTISTQSEAEDYHDTINTFQNATDDYFKHRYFDPLKIDE